MAEEKKTGTTPEEKPQGGADSGPKKKKINEMTIQEIEAKLAEVKEKQGGLVSKYARQLLLRKKSLSS